MNDNLLTIGIGLVVAAIVGGGMKILNAFEIPGLTSYPRQLLLAALGAILIVTAQRGPVPTPPDFTERTRDFLREVDFARIAMEIQIPALYSVTLSLSHDPNPERAREEMNDKISYSLGVVKKIDVGLQNHDLDPHMIRERVCPKFNELQNNLRKFDVASHDDSYDIAAALPALRDLCESLASRASN